MASGKVSSLQLQAVSGEGLSCEPPAVSCPSRWEMCAWLLQGCLGGALRHTLIPGLTALANTHCSVFLSLSEHLGEVDPPWPEPAAGPRVGAKEGAWHTSVSLSDGLASLPTAPGRD